MSVDRIDDRSAPTRDVGPPEWIAALSDFALKHGFRAAGDQIGYSPSVVSLVLAGRYPGRLDRVEAATRKVLIDGIRSCPVLGQIVAGTCRRYLSPEPPTASPLALTVWKACRDGCPHFTRDRNAVR